MKIGGDIWRSVLGSNGAAFGTGGWAGLGGGAANGRAWPWPAEIQQCEGSNRRERHHEVSIPIATIEVVGRDRGEATRSKVSMTIMRPPQDGYGRVSGGSLPSALSS